MKDIGELNKTLQIVSRPGGSVVSVSDSLPGGREFDPRLRPTFFTAYFRLLPLQKPVRMRSWWLWEEKLCSYWCEKARKHMCVTDSHDMTLAVKVVLNPNTTNQPTNSTYIRIRLMIAILL